MICLDAGRMMASKTGYLSKLDYAVNSALILSYVALKYGDRVGLTVFSSGLKAYLAPKSGRAQFTRFMDVLYGITPELVYVDYKAMLKYIALKNKRRTLMVIFTDLTDEENAQHLVRYLPILRPTHLSLCIAINDPNIVSLVNQFPRQCTDIYNKGVALEILEERAEILKRLTKEGALILDKTPEEVSVAAVNKYLELKTRQLL
jgi:uncharacterized protein (DUF58 family)